MTVWKLIWAVDNTTGDIYFLEYLVFPDKELYLKQFGEKTVEELLKDIVKLSPPKMEKHIVPKNYASENPSQNKTLMAR